MSEPFLAEVRIVAFNFAPRGWAFCDGQILPINQNQSLYSLLGTTYGGDGHTSFALPDLRGRSPMHVGSSNGTNHRQGEKGGEETHTLSVAEMPNHDHTARATSAAATTDSATDGANLLAKSPEQIYRSPADLVPMKANSVTSVGGGQAHENMPPYLVVNFAIALRGLFPSRN
jgi:microcystin-dependent protein